MLGRSALQADSAAVLGLGSRRITRCVRCALCARTDAASQFTMRAARADPRPALLAAPEIAPAGYRLPRRPPAAACLQRKPRCIGKGAGGQPAARLCAAEKRRARGRARSALRDLTRRICPSAVSAANVASYATGPRDRASQGTLAQRGQATKRCRLPARAFARADARHAEARQRTHASALRPLSAKIPCGRFWMKIDDQHQHHDLGQHRTRESFEQLVQHAQPERGIDGAGQLADAAEHHHHERVDDVALAQVGADIADLRQARSPPGRRCPSRAQRHRCRCARC